MDEKVGYPRAAMRWTVDAQHHDYTANVFQAIVVANGFSVLIEHELPDARRHLSADSLSVPPVVWSEHDYMRSLLARWDEAGSIVLISQVLETVEVSVASNDLEAAREIIEAIDKLLPREPIRDDTVLPIRFWHLGNEGAERTVRQIELARWSDLASNYSANAKARLTTLMEGFEPAKDNGRLLLWHGEPGTGKTFAIRALAWAWKDWCRFEYVIDPERLFDSGSYLTQVVLERQSDRSRERIEGRDKWRLLIVEDSGEMLAMDAKSQIGQSLSRLLNLSDGILGQGTKLMILVTTNEDLGKLSPAVMRHGRCLSEIEFGRFSIEEGRAWLLNAGCEAHLDVPRTLSELYAIRAGHSVTIGSKKIGFRSTSTVSSDQVCLADGR